MEFNFIINPETSKKVSIHSLLGKKVLGNYLNYLSELKGGKTHKKKSVKKSPKKKSLKGGKKVKKSPKKKSLKKKSLKGGKKVKKSPKKKSLKKKSKK